jgi:hypothetical protein
MQDRHVGHTHGSGNGKERAQNGSWRMLWELHAFVLESMTSQQDSVSGRAKVRRGHHTQNGTEHDIQSGRNPSVVIQTLTVLTLPLLLNVLGAQASQPFGLQRTFAIQTFPSAKRSSLSRTAGLLLPLGNPSVLAKIHRVQISTLFENGSLPPSCSGRARHHSGDRHSRLRRAVLDGYPAAIRPVAQIYVARYIDNDLHGRRWPWCMSTHVLVLLLALLRMKILIVPRLNRSTWLIRPQHDPLP